MNLAAGNTFYMAPMAEITTPSFRRCIRSFSNEVILHTEMLSAAAITGFAIHNEPLMHIDDCDDPIVYQILGNDPAVMADACILLKERGARRIDINMGCSAPDILKKCQGSKLLTDIKLAGEIVNQCRRSFNGILSVKMRSGYENSNIQHLLEFARMLQSAGVDYITLHPRYARLSFKRTADWRLVKILKDNLSIPVVGNGDISTPEEAVARIKETGCDGVMIARMAVQCPWIFRAIIDLVSKGCYRIEVDMENIFTGMLHDLKNFFPENLHRSRAHRFCFYFSRNFYFSHDLFKKIRNVDRIEFMINIIEDYFSRNPHERVKVFEGGTVHGIYESLDRN